MKLNNRNIALIIPLILVLIGICLQFWLGEFPLHLFKFPVNLIVIIQLILIIIASYIFLRKNKIILFLASGYAALSSMLLFAFVVIIMAIYPQTGQISNILDKLGFSNIILSWIYAISVIYLLLSLGTITVKRIVPFKTKNLFFFLNHFGLWIVLAFGNLSQADKVSISITVPEAETIWYGYDKKNNYVEPDFAIELTKFTIEFYPPKLGLIDNNGNLLNPKIYQPREIIKAHSLNIINNDVYVIDLIENAIVINDSIRRVAGLPEKTYIAVLQINTDTVYLQNGTEFSPPVIYEIDQNYKLVILNPEPKYFGSEIKLYTKSGITNEIHKIEVNKPLEIGNWKVYQTSYFKTPEFKGYVSVFTAVFDPWLNATYCGIALMFIGAISLIFKRKISKKEE